MTVSAGVLSGVGVGPGDPELITVKALRRINEADVIAFFGAVGRESNARRVVADLLRGDQPELRLVYPVTTETLASIIDYRLKVQLKSGLVFPAQIDSMRIHLGRFRSAEIDLAAIRSELLTAFPGDRINTILATL